MHSRSFIFLSLGAYLGLSIAYLFFGEFHPDEGFYTLVGKLVYQGKLPYRDFLYVQSPIYPYISGILQVLWKQGLMAGRISSIIFGVLTFLISVYLARRLGGITASLITAGLLGFNSFQIYHFSIVKLYSLCSFFITLSAYFLCSNLRNPWKNILSVICMALAVGVRITVFPVFLLLLLYLIIQERNSKRDFILPTIVGLLSLASIFLPFIILCPEQVTFNLVTYHLIKENIDIQQNTAQLFSKVAFIVPQDLAAFVFPKIAFSLIIVSRLGREYFLALLLISLILLNTLFLTTQDKPKFNQIALLWSWIIIFALTHLVAKVTFVDQYLTPIFPLAAVLTGTGIARLAATLMIDAKLRKSLMLTFILGCFFTSISYGAKHLTRYQGKNTLAYIEEIGNFLQEKTPPYRPIMTFNNCIALAAGREVLPGTEMAAFAYDPEWTRERAKKYRLLNEEMLIKTISSGAVSAIIFTKNTFSHHFPQFFRMNSERYRRVIESIKDNYYLAKTFPDLGYQREEVYVYLFKR